MRWVSQWWMFASLSDTGELVTDCCSQLAEDAIEQPHNDHDRYVYLWLSLTFTNIRLHTF